MTVAICALTYKRPEGVRDLLDGLSGLGHTKDLPPTRIIIVDNDPDESARAICEVASHGIPFPLQYVAEPRPGIAAARNAALSAASEDEFICFIDDDEIPAPDWLHQLLRAQDAYSADVVGGPALPILPPDTPEWVRKSSLLDYNRHVTGTQLPYAFTNNVLFRSAVVREMNLEFDQRYGLTGGEDRHFFQRIGLAGYRIVWCDEAIVRETIPLERTSAGWIIKRNYRYGNTWSLVELDLRPGLKTRLKLPLMIGYRLLKGLVFLLLTLPLGKREIVRYVAHMAFGLGMISGYFGSRFREYARSDG
jgi:glycosyltransferase involved in cell wall biosynthesis